MLRSLKLLVIVISSVPLYAQSKPTPVPATSAPTLRTSTQLVVVDVVVTDKNQHPVHSLKSADFTVLEANQPQAVRNFEEHTALPAAEAAKLPAMPKLPPGIFTNFSPVPEGSAVNVLLLDSLDTPMKDQTFVRDQLLKYVKSAPAGTRVAIFGLTTRLIMLQGFTSDPELLKAVVEKKAGAKGSALLDDVVGTGAPESVTDSLNDIADGSPDAANLIANVQQFEAQNQSFQTMLRARYTLDAMNLLARYLSAIPGRKNLIWFSGSFPINILPDGDLKDPFAVVADAADEFRETTNLLARSQVAVYPIDARGLMPDPTMSATTSGSKYVRNPQQFGKDQTKFFQQTAAEHGTMMQMAEETGGKAFVNTNALAESVSKAIEAGSNYYTLTYAPSDPKHDGSFRKIQVKMAQQGLTLTYRRGYYSDDTRSSAKTATAGSDGAGTTPPIAISSNIAKTVSASMMHGSPTPSQVLLKARILPSATLSEDTIAHGNSLNPQATDKAVKGPYRRYVVDLAADPRSLAFEHEPDGKYLAQIEVLAVIYDPDGVRINSIGNAIHANVPAEAYQQMLQTGIQFHLEISVPLKGEYYLRLGLHDISSNRVGAMEVPIARVRNLSPANPPAVAPK